MGERAPAFQFYPKDFLSSGKVIAMSMAERGVYITLLAVQWQEGSLPTDLTALAHIVGIQPRQFARMWPHNLARCFSERGGRLVNDRIEQEREKQAIHRAAQADRGRASGVTRRQRTGSQMRTGVEPDANQRSSLVHLGREPETNQLATGREPDTNSSSAVCSLQTASGVRTISSCTLEDSTKETGTKSPISPNDGEQTLMNIGVFASRPVDGGSDTPLDVWFARLKSLYPPHRVTSGHRTMTAFVDALTRAPEGQEAAFGRMLSNLALAKQAHEWRVKGMVPKLENWLASGAWEQIHEAAPPETLITDKTARTMTSAAAFIAGGDDEPQ